MPPKKRKQIDPLEQAIESVLSPGMFIYHSDAWSLMEDVRDVASEIGKIVKKDPKRAAYLYEIFIAGCHEKAGEIDDSSGDIGILVEELFCGWVQARRTAKDDPGETARLLISWMEDDPYGFCHHLDRAVVNALNKKGLDAFVHQVRSKFESIPAQDDSEKGSHDYARRRWGEVLKNLLAAQRDAEAYITFCDQTEFLAKDCVAIAKIYLSRRRREDALAWVERGLETAGSDSKQSYEESRLSELKRELLFKLGRREDALQSAWSEFESHPAALTYKELMRYVPAKEKKAWRQKAMETSEKGDLSYQIELWLDNNESDRLVSRMRRTTDEELEGLSHYSTEPLARNLEGSHPDISARVYRALGMRIVNAGKSRYYGAALANIENAKKCYSKAGLDADWQAVVDDVRERHFRKKGFMAGFEDIVAGKPKHVDPPFLERAKARWLKKRRAGCGNPTRPDLRVKSSDG